MVWNIHLDVCITFSIQKKQDYSNSPNNEPLLIETEIKMTKYIA